MAQEEQQIVQMVDRLGRPVTWSYNQISDNSKVKEAKRCVKPLRDGLIDSLKKSSD